MGGSGVLKYLQCRRQLSAREILNLPPPGPERIYELLGAELAPFCSYPAERLYCIVVVTQTLQIFKRQIVRGTYSLF